MLVVLVASERLPFAQEPINICTDPVAARPAAPSAAPASAQASMTSSMPPLLCSAPDEFYHARYEGEAGSHARLPYSLLCDAWLHW
jgi:hypothetical protein